MFHLRLRELRKEKKLNQQCLALELHISQATVSAYETGERVPELNTLLAMCDYFHVSLDYLLGLSSSRKPLDLGLTDGEKELIGRFRTLSHGQQACVMAYVEGISCREPS